MAASGGRSSSTLTRLLEKQWYRFSFFQAVRLLELIADEGDFLPDGANKPIGRDNAPGQEVLRLKGWPSKSFPATEICSLEITQGKQESQRPPVEVAVSFMGMYGPSGVLPPHYTQQIIEEKRGEGSGPLRDFYDIFNHRVLSLFYRAWEKYRFYVGFERRRFHRSVEPDLFSQSLFSLVGLGSDSLRNRMEISDDLFVYYGGHFSCQPRNCISLERMLGDIFRLPIDVEQFHGQWLQIEPDEISSMPSASNPRGVNCRLGFDVVAGTRVWTVENKFRIRVGPVGYEQFKEFMPGQYRLAQIAQIVRQYVGPTFDFDVQVILQADDVPQCHLKPTDQPERMPRLGYNTWLFSGELEDDRDEGVFVHDGYPTGENN